MSAYSNIEEAYASAKTNINTIGTAKAWTRAQIDAALSDAEAAYSENSGFLNSAASLLGNYQVFTTFESMSKDAEIEQAQKFWTALYQSASTKWGAYPNIKDVLSWIRSASGATATVAEAAQTEKLTNQVIGGVTQTAQDLNDAGEKAVEIATDKTTWYAIGAVATLAGLVYIRSIVRGLV